VAADGPSYGSSTHYDADYFAWQDANARLKAELKVEVFGRFVQSEDTVIDFGAAGGSMLAALPGARRIGVELNDVARGQASSRYGLEVYKTLDLVPDGIADVLVSNHTLEHLEAPFDALRQMRGKLKPDGRLVLVLPIDDWRVRKARKWDPTDVDRHLYTWTPLNLGNLLAEAGYHPEHLEILHRTLMRSYARAARLPRPVFRLLMWAFSRLRHRQELLAVARLAPTKAH
jgi:SAM-dependent methyltransferase